MEDLLAEICAIIILIFASIGILTVMRWLDELHRWMEERKKKGCEKNGRRGCS